MKYTRYAPATAALLAGLLPFKGNAQDYGQTETYGPPQTYYYSGPVGGYADVALTPGGTGTGEMVANFGAIDETMIYDPVAQTLTQQGTLQMTPGGSFAITGDHSAGFATVAIGDNGVVAFDQTSSVYYDLFEMNFDIPVTATGVLNGQAFTASWDVPLEIFGNIGSIAPQGLSFDENSGFSPAPASEVVPALGLYDGSTDGTYANEWNIDPVATPAPANVPDSSGMPIEMGLGVFSLLAVRGAAGRFLKGLKGESAALFQGRPCGLEKTCG